jgi:hypothetical protein
MQFIDLLENNMTQISFGTCKSYERSPSNFFLHFMQLAKFLKNVNWHVELDFFHKLL